jgi:hypothetical protein
MVAMDDRGPPRLGRPLLRWVGSEEWELLAPAEPVGRRSIPYAWCASVVVCLGGHPNGRVASQTCLGRGGLAWAAMQTVARRSANVRNPPVRDRPQGTEVGRPASAGTNVSRSSLPTHLSSLRRSAGRPRPPITIVSAPQKPEESPDLDGYPAIRMANQANPSLDCRRSVGSPAQRSPGRRGSTAGLRADHTIRTMPRTAFAQYVGSPWLQARTRRPTTVPSCEPADRP